MSRLVAILLTVLFAGVAHADVGAQFTAPNLRAPDDPNVSGFRFALFYGQANSMKGLDLGLASLNESKQFSGVSLVFGISRVTGESNGCLCSFINVHAGTAKGLNAAFVNTTKTVEGGNIGFVNITEGHASWELGGLSMADSSKVQIGFVNITKRIDSLQIGFLNMAENGFFPIFPFFNYRKK